MVLLGGLAGGLAGSVAYGFFTGALMGGAMGAAAGGTEAVLSNRIETGSWSGSMQAFTDGAASGFCQGTISGGVMGSIGAGVKYGMNALGKGVNPNSLVSKGSGEAYSPLTGKGGYNGKVTAGDGFGKLANKEMNVSQKGFEKVKDHISSNGFDAPENTAMINRLGQAMKNGEKITGADASFYMHELKENTLMNGGMSYNAAHKIALETYNVSPFSVYHPDVFKLNPASWGKSWFDFWGL